MGMKIVNFSGIKTFWKMTPTFVTGMERCIAKTKVHEKTTGYSLIPV